MKVQNTLAKNLETVDAGKVSLDRICKKLLSNKVILARILKTCVKEYQECSLKEIEEKYIEGTPQVAQSPVHQGESAEMGESVVGSRNEDSSMTEETITYDIKFEAVNPQHFLMMINVECQSDFYPGYSLPKRGTYYGSRMISAQYGTVFTRSHYEKLRKVYSIWICLNPPKYRRNSINLYSFHEEQLLGKVCEKKENYDLMTIVMICLGREEESTGLIRLLSVLLSTKINAEEKKRILELEFGIEMTKEMEEEASDMCDFGRYVEEQAMQRGMQRGMQQGLQRGMQQGIQAFIEICQELGLSLIQTLEKLSTKFSLTNEQAQAYIDEYWNR